MNLPKSVQNFIDVFSRLPGLGPRQSARLAFWLLRQDKKTQNRFYQALNSLLSQIEICPNCFFIKEKDGTNKLCKICSDSSRDQTTVCVVEKETDVLSIEKTNKYGGVYHVLGKMLSEIDGYQKTGTKIPQLLSRIKKSQSSPHPIKEIIIALSPTSEGNLTTYTLEKEIKKLDDKIKITRLARGLPQGGEVEFADAETLINALEGRK